MALSRLSDWQGRLSQFLSERQDETFHYGRWDCCLFVCSAIWVMTGVDPAAGYRGAYSSRAGARRALLAYCGTASVRTFAETFTATYGMRETTPFHAHRGDVALIRRSRDYSLGLVALNGREVLVLSPRGLHGLSLSAAVRAWNV
jgi:hypothetical protein